MRPMALPQAALLGGLLAVALVPAVTAQGRGRAKPAPEAPATPNLVWVGTGEANLRNDLVDGRGVFFSPDAGKTWKFMGLGDVGQISRVVVDPTDPDVVFVGAIGHAWAPNPERGVYRTADGGKT